MGAVALECGYKIPDHKTGKLYIANLFKGIASSVYKAADEVISVSECNISEQKSLGAQKVQYIPNGVGTDWIKQGKSRSEIFTVGWIGRCAEMKNPLRYFDFLDAIDIQVKGLMMLSDAGEDQLKRRVNKRAGEYANIELVWNRPAAERIDEMDALCITSHNESQPLVLFEALSRQVLPVGWQVGDVSEKYAVVVEPQSPVKELAQKITTLWEDQSRWKSELEKRFTEFKKYHTWQAIFDQYGDIIEPNLKPS
jgi:glycosyltransferase involved in cell wall biosynthesis